jgi:hypothetical protein
LEDEEGFDKDMVFSSNFVKKPSSVSDNMATKYQNTGPGDIKVQDFTMAVAEESLFSFQRKLGRG